MKIKKRGINKKGISPLIATVLLIGFTIVLAALVIRWGSQLFGDVTTQQSCESEAIIECTSSVDVETASVELRTNAATDPNKLKFTLVSNGETEIKDFIVRVHKGDGSVDTWDLPTAAPGTNLQSFGSKTFTIDTTTAPGPYSGTDCTAGYEETFCTTDCEDKFCGISIIPMIDHETEDGITCENTCIQNEKKHKFVSGDIVDA